MVLLDTCALLALTVSGSMLPGAAAAVRRAQAVKGVLIPSVAASEVAQKVWVGKLQLPPPQTARAWFARVMATPGFVELGTSVDAALAAYELPEPFHKDPADRLIVAMARRLGIPVVTSDGRILDYAALGHVRAIAC